jgi:actin related protein 2/3 complex, subunit 1A/1B
VLFFGDVIVNEQWFHRPAATVWGEKLPFNTVCGEFSSASGGWVHSVSFSPGGDLLAFVSK